MFSKRFIIALIIGGIIGINSSVFAAANPFSDVPAKHWAYDYVVMLANRVIIEGYGEGTFRGDRTITRYEAATIISKTLKTKYFSKDDDSALPFSDVTENHWAYSSVKVSSGMGIIKGYDDKTFRGDRYITRYEMAQMLYNFLKANLGDYKAGANPFADISDNHWAKNAVIILASKGIIEGYGDSKFRGDRNITRYEASAMISKTILTKS